VRLDVVDAAELAAVDDCPQARRAASAIRAASAAFEAMGFSHRTCFPASSARIVHSQCRLFGSGL
jgi:hypothetical protein